MRRRLPGLLVIGVLLGLASAVAGVVGLVLSLVVAAAAYARAPVGLRAQSAGVLLTTASALVAILLGKLVLVDARDPAIGLMPDTNALFLGFVALTILGLAAVVAGRRPMSK